MKQSLFIMLLILSAFTISTFIFLYLLPEYIKQEGPLIIVLITLSIMVVTFVFERLFTLNKAKGQGSLIKFLTVVKQEIMNGNIDGAIKACDKQRGSGANILRSGLERYKLLKTDTQQLSQKEVLEEVQHSIDDSMMLEVPLLEKNLVALSTIASIATPVGLLGTTIGMIRAFKALAHSGTPDAIQLSLGISEALVNTAGGLFAAILGIVAYNYFFTRIDNFTYMIDEASFSMIKTLTSKQENR